MDITCVIPLAAILTIMAVFFYFRGQSGPKTFFKGAVIATIVPGPIGIMDTVQLEFTERGAYQIAFLRAISFNNTPDNQVIVVQKVPYQKKLYIGTFFRPLKIAITLNRVTETRNLY